jgi:hypothetical protein
MRSVLPLLGTCPVIQPQCFCNNYWRNVQVYLYKYFSHHLFIFCCHSFFFLMSQRKRDEGTGSWRKVHNEELHNLYSSPDIIRMNKSRRITWAGM